MSDSDKSVQKMVYRPYKTTRLFHRDNSIVRGILGPVGSSKSSACICELRFRAGDQEPDANGWRRTKWVATRSSYPSLVATTIDTFSRWMPQAKVKMTPPMVWRWKQENAGRDKDGKPDGTHIDMEVQFLSISDLMQDEHKVRSLNITGVWVNEAQEIDDAGIVKILLSRCGRYPDPQVAPLTWSGLIMDANAMDTDHWWYQYAEMIKPAGWKFFRQPPALLKIVDAEQIAEIKKGDEKAWRNGDGGIWIINPECENVVGQPKHEQYWLDLVEGNHESWIRLNLCGEYGQSLSGRPIFVEFDERRHVAKEPLNPVPGIPIQLGMDAGLCYSEDTEVLTDKGWKFFKDVDPTVDIVITLDPKTKEISYTKINFKTARHYEGDMLHFKTQNMDFIITPEHRVPNSTRENLLSLIFNEAQELEKKTTSHRYIQLSGKWNGIGYSLLGLSEELSMKFWAWYLSEGSLEFHWPHARICITQKNHTTELEEVLFNPEWKKIGISWYKNGQNYRATSKKLCEILCVTGLAHDKYIIRDLFLCSPESAKVFLRTYVYGDGHARTKTKINSGIGRKNREEWICYTVSNRMKNDLQEMCLKAGWSSSSKLRHCPGSVMKDGRKIPPCDIWYICIKKIDRAEIIPDSVKRIKYNGMIYCLNVPFHTLYIRRNGRTCWNGNTPACAICQITHQGQLRVLDECTSSDMGMRRFIQDVVKPFLSAHYAGIPVSAVCDPAANQRAQSNESTAMEEIRAQGIDCMQAPTNLFGPRRDAVASFMTKRVNSIISGKPIDEGFVVSPTCTLLLKGLRGDYKFKLMKVDGKDVPQAEAMKNEASHVCDALQYVAVKYDRPQIDMQMRQRMANRNGEKFEIGYAKDYPCI